MATSHTPRQNRVNPFGDIIAVPDRGLFMGNCGILHDEHHQLVVRPNTTRVPWKTKAWIICRLDFNRRQRQGIDRVPSVAARTTTGSSHCGGWHTVINR